jgi:hypothetical protein
MQQQHKAHQFWALQLWSPKAILDMEAKKKFLPLPEIKLHVSNHFTD